MNNHHQPASGPITAPLSFEQERMWLLDTLVGGDPVNNLSAAVELNGELDIAVLTQSLQGLVARHEILRTHFAETAGAVCQVISPSLDIALPIRDLQGLPVARQRQDVTVLSHQHMQRRIDLRQSPLWTLELIRLSHARHVLVLVIHHILCDGDWSTRLFFEEAFARYAAVQQGQPDTLPGPALHYRDFAAQQRQSLTDEVLAPHRRYWTQQLGPSPTILQLPTDRPRPAVQTYRGAAEVLVMNDELSEQLRQLASRTDTSVFAVVLSIFTVLLYRYTRQETLTVGSPSTGRTMPDSDGLIGYFGTPLVLKAEMTPDLSFETVLVRTSDTVAQALAYQDYPFQKLLEALNPERDPSFPPLFQVLMELREHSLGPLAAGPLDISPLDIPAHAVPYDLFLSIKESDRAFHWTFTYNTDLFDASTVRRMAGHCRTLAQAIVTNPAQTVARLPLLSDAEYQLFMTVWNPVSRTDYQRICIHHRIEEQVGRTPDTAAVCFEGITFSYRELNARSNQLAHYLLQQGLLPDQLVGICMERSLELLVAILATMKAGGAYVPLDAAYPEDRLEYMLSDAGARMVLTTQATLAAYPQLARMTRNHHCILLDDEHPAWAGERTDNPHTEVQPDHLAYCIYTSGSTGRPKGVEMTHGALSNLIAWHLEHWLAEVGVRTLLFSPISFDVSFHEIAAAWCSGGTLIQIREEIRRNAIALLEFIQEQRIEKAYFPFITLQQLAALVAEGYAAPDTLREIIIGGEPLQITPHIRDFLQQTGCRLHNQYGSTECLVVTAYSLEPDAVQCRQVPIGKPDIYNTRVYVLDEALQPVPIGVSGEIFADSDCLARGYHNRPELTAQRFIPNPFRPDFAGRLYRIGDLGRYLSDGNIECLGRADHQVKIRGIRIELGEIEQVLAEHPQVRECVVMPREDTPGYKRLIGYVVPADDGDRTQLPSRLRSDLQRKLPEAMVPSVLVMLDTLPLTPSGKIDRRQLSALALSTPQSSTTRTPPGSAIERQIAKVWRQVLRVDEVGIHDSFFELGGNSLFLVQVQKELEKLLNIELTPLTLFQYPTIDALARHLSTPTAAAVHQRRTPAPPRTQGREAVAVIGCSCRFPGAEDPQAFWTNLANGVESIRTFDDHELDLPNPAWLDQPNYVKAGAPLRAIDECDAAFFGFSAREAALTDPQQRVLLECAWEALEHAGYADGSDQASGRVGVYVGAALSTYLLNNVAPTLGFSAHNPFLETEALQAKLSNDRNYYATRIAYKLNLTGPALTIQTACSTSLVTVHAACQSLLQEECDMALAGGVSIPVPEKTGYLYRAGMINSPDGHCRAFDAQAEGTLFGSGAGFVVLKRLTTALADGDHILAVVRGSAINNDGAAKVGYTAPSIAGQADAIGQAFTKAGWDPASVSYVETHGTATTLGDPIEIAALIEAFNAKSQTGALPKQYCAIGSVKTNVGHLDEAAGIASFIKTALALHHKQLPPSLNFQTPNPQIDFASSPFYVNTRLADWQRPGPAIPRRAGVSAFGMGGTNCHVLLEEAPDRLPTANPVERSHHLLTLSAPTVPALQALVTKYQDHLRDTQPLAGLCFTANTGRRHFPCRLAIVADSLPTLASQLQDWQATATAGGHDHPPVNKIVFLFTGQGSQYADMGLALYQTQPVFRAVIDRCDAALRDRLERPLLSVLYPAGDASPIDQTGYTQPAIFALECALFALWKSWGIEPDIVLGHSVGEYAAACAAGVFSLEDGLTLIAARGRLMQALPPGGAMLSVMAGRASLEAPLAAYPGRIDIAAINGPYSTVVSGDATAIQSLGESLRAAGIRCQPLNVSHAFHSHLMEPMLEGFAQAAQEITFSLPRYTLISTLTGNAIADEIAQAAYWVRQVRQPVRFAESMRTLGQLGEVDTFVEIGPQPTLLGMAQHCLTLPSAHWLPSLRAGFGDWETLLGSLKVLYLHKARIDWRGFDHAYQRRRLPLPTYPFQRQRYWLEPERRVPPAPELPPRNPAHGLLYQVRWIAQPVADNEVRSLTGETWLILADSRTALGTEVAARLADDQVSCILAYVGPHFEQTGHDRFVLSPVDTEGFRRLLAARPAIDGIVHCWSLNSTEDAPGRGIEDGCGSTLHLVQALVDTAACRQRRRLYLVTQGAQAVNEHAVTQVSQAPLWGFGKVIALEHPELNCMRLDLDSADGIARAAQQLCSEVRRPSAEDQVAYRGGTRYVARLQAAALPPPRVGAWPVHDGTYLIAGGLGALGLKVAELLIERGARYLLLLGRRAPGPAARQQIGQWEQRGVQVVIGQVDVADKEQLAALLGTAPAGFPPVRGVIQAAGVLDDGIIRKLTWERFTQVLAPKVQGSWNLHQLTQAQALDFFVLFSSSSSLLGTAGQANYCAANMFLDALASYRQARGQPALAINWGAWSEIGITARLQMNARLEEQGEGSLSPETGLRALEALLQETPPTPQWGVLAIDWGRFLTGQWAMAPFFRQLGGEATSRGQGKIADQPAPSLLQALSRLSPEALAAQLKEHVCHCVVAVLGVNGDALRHEGEAAGFFDLGMDSLSSIELRNALQTRLALPLPATLAFDYPTITALTGFLATEITARCSSDSAGARLPSEPPVEPAASASAGAGSLADIAAHLARQLGLSAPGEP